MPGYFAHGKLMITAEYAVLLGALALAVPTQKGQHLIVEDDGPGLKWRSIDHIGNTWFAANFDSDLNLIEASDINIASRLELLLRSAKKLSPGFDCKNKRAITQLNFPNNWGLGSSSTLVALVAQWAGCDALQLFFASMSGSGYDVACAVANTPILYNLNKGEASYQQVQINWGFTDQIFFVYLGEKQNSAKEVSRFNELDISEHEIQFISNLTNKILASENLRDFEENIAKHETAIGDMIGIEPIKQRLFTDYPGVIKSLGAWGGDFILVTGSAQEMEYFRQGGFTTILSWDEMVL